MFVYGKNPGIKLQFLGQSNWFTLKNYWLPHPVWREKLIIKYIFFGYCILETVSGSIVGWYQAKTSSHIPVLVQWCGWKKTQPNKNCWSQLSRAKIDCFVCIWMVNYCIWHFKNWRLQKRSWKMIRNLETILWANILKRSAHLLERI